MLIKYLRLFQFDSKVHYKLRMVIYDLAKNCFNHRLPQTLLKIVGFGVMFTIG